MKKNTKIREDLHTITLLLPHTATTRLEAISQWQKIPFLCKPPTAFQSLRKNSGNANTHFSLTIRLFSAKIWRGPVWIKNNYPKCPPMTITWLKVFQKDNGLTIWQLPDNARTAISYFFGVFIWLGFLSRNYWRSLDHDLEASIWEKATSILVGNLN